MNNENRKLTIFEVDNYFNNIYAKDEWGKYKNLKFTDYKGTISFIGKSDNDLDTSEIVRLKKSAGRFYELFDSITLADVETIEFVAKMLGISFMEIVFYVTKLENELLDISVPGGKRVIINSMTKEFLIDDITISFEVHLKRFLVGERTNGV